MSWNDERVELLKKLWSEGLSASQIASRLGNITRNAVIGKVHRLGLAGRATTSRMKSHRPRPRPNGVAVPGQPAKRTARTRFQQPSGTPGQRPAFTAEGEPYTPPAEDVFIPFGERKTVLDLQEGHCRWPIGDPQNEDFHFCGHTKTPGTPYCQHHAMRAFQPMQPRRRDRDLVVVQAAIRLPADAAAPADAKAPGKAKVPAR